MSENPYQSAGLDADAADENEVRPQRRWRRNLGILAWLAIGSPAGWAGCTLLWRSGCLSPSHDALATFVFMVGPMILTGAFGARRHPELLRRLVVFSLAAAGLAWTLLTPSLNMPPAHLSRMYVDEV